MVHVSVYGDRVRGVWRKRDLVDLMQGKGRKRGGNTLRNSNGRTVACLLWELRRGVDVTQ